MTLTNCLLFGVLLSVSSTGLTIAWLMIYIFKGVKLKSSSRLAESPVSLLPTDDLVIKCLAQECDENQQTKNLNESKVCI